MMRSRLSKGLAFAPVVLTVCLFAAGCSKKSTPTRGAGTPEITAVIPDNGDVGGGTVVTVETAGFRDDFLVDLPEVYFGSDPAAVTPIDADTLSAVAPSHPVAEAVDVEVRSVGIVESAVLVGGFTYTVGLCSVSAVTPGQGSTLGGETVLIDGASFDVPPLPPPTVEFGAGNPSPNVVPLGPDRLQVVTPPGTAGVVDVIVTTRSSSCARPGGFEYLPVPPSCTVLSVSPDHGLTWGGEILYVDGSNFDLAPPPMVEFGAGNPSPYVRSLSDTRLEVETPAGANGPVDVVITNQSGRCTLPGGYDYQDPPSGGACSVTALTPNVGPAAGGTLVIVDGANFDVEPISRPVIEFGPGNLGTDVRTRGTTQFEAVTPPGAPGLVDVIVSNRVGYCVLEDGFEYLPPPPCSVTSIDPVIGPEFGGNNVSIYGSGFDDAGLTVWFGPTEAPSVTFVSDTELRVQAPPGVGGVDVTVDLWGWTTCTLPMSYIYVSCGGVPCQLTRVDPGVGGVGDTVTIRGNDFLAGSLVYFGSSLATVVDETALPRRIGVTVPPPLDGNMTVDVHVIHPSGVCCTRSAAFSYEGCTLLSLSRTDGPDYGGTPLSIYGQGFSTSPDPEVWFGTQQCSFVFAIDFGEIIVQTPPANGQDVVDVMVINPDGGVCVCLGCFTYNYGCTITSIVPDSGGTNGGDIVVISGSDFDTKFIKIRFEDTYADPFTAIVDPLGTTITLHSPPSFTGGPKSVRVINETLITRCTALDGFTYILPGGSPCTVTDIDPNRGVDSGGDTVIIRGSGFDPATGVLFGLVGSSQVTFLSSSEIEVLTPVYMGDGSPDSVDVVVSPANGGPCLVEDGFLYEPPQPPPPSPCQVTAVSPSSGPVSGRNIVTITGTGFSNNNPQIIFGGSTALTTYMDATTLVAEVPAAPGPGAVDVFYTDDDGCTAVPPCFSCYTYN